MWSPLYRSNNFIKTSPKPSRNWRLQLPEFSCSMVIASCSLAHLENTTLDYTVQITSLLRDRGNLKWIWRLLLKQNKLGQITKTYCVWPQQSVYHMHGFYTPKFSAAANADWGILGTQGYKSRRHLNWGGSCNTLRSHWMSAEHLFIPFIYLVI